MSAALKMTRRPFAIKQHVKAADHQGVGKISDNWNWNPKKPHAEIIFSETRATNRTRTNTNGIADQGEYY